MKAEIYFLVITIVILVAVGVYYFVKPKPIDFNIDQVKTTKEDDVVLGYKAGDQDNPSSEVNLGQDNPQNNSMNNQTQNAQPTQPKESKAPAMEIDEDKTYTATLKTTEGDIVIELTPKMTPITVNNFVHLAKTNFYNNTIFHRVIKGFMIQGGDPTGTGAGGPGYKFEDEPFEGDYTRGTVAMANAGPDTNGSQFFIMHADSPLPPNYTIFGKVTTGLEVVDKIAEAEVTAGSSGEGSTPVKPVKVNTVTITQK